LLLLFLCALHEHSPTAKKIHSVYVMSAYPFTEVDEFVNTSVREYSLDLHRYALPMKDAFATYLVENKKGDEEGIKAIFVGTRRTDPHGEKLHHFDRTDQGWPDFMRIQPVIDWGYQDVWTVSFPGGERLVGDADEANQVIVLERARSRVLFVV
jgi:FAD synthetase